MKYLLITLATILLVIEISGQKPEQTSKGSSEQIDKIFLHETFLEAVTQMANECKDKFNNGTSYRQEDIEALIVNETKIQDEIKCLQACILKTTSIINESNKLDEQYSAEFMNDLLGIENKISKEICKKCNLKITEKNECEAAYQLTICIKNELRSKHICMQYF